MPIKLHHFFVFVLLALGCANKKNPRPALSSTPTSSAFQKGEYFLDSTAHTDSAFYFFNTVTENSKDSLLVAMADAYMAMIQNDNADYYGVQETSLAGIKLLNESNPDNFFCLASLYNVLGRSNVSLKQFDEAIKHYNVAMQFQPYEAYKNSYRNNIAVALREKGDYQGALQMFLSIKPDSNESKADFARRTTNIASLKWKVEKYNPVSDLHQALALRIQEQADIGITASYNHLSDYYMAARSDSALLYAARMFEVSKRTNNVEDQLDALRKLTKLAPVAEAKTYFEQYERLDDSIQLVQSAAKNQFAVIRYESEKSKAQNLLLQQENEARKFQVRNQQLISAGIILLALLITVTAIKSIRRKKKKEAERFQAQIKENQLKLSEKIHDTVANGLYRIMSEIEHEEVIDKDKLLDRVEQLYEQSRDISYETIDSQDPPEKQIDQTLSSFATSAIKISIVGNQKDLWQDVSPGTFKELAHVLQELAVNMKKHSGARHVVFYFSRSKERVHILYKDDGSGFQANFKKGNGLRSTENRIRQIGGETTFTTENASGAEIKINVPII